MINHLFVAHRNILIQVLLYQVWVGSQKCLLLPHDNGVRLSPIWHIICVLCQISFDQRRHIKLASLCYLQQFAIGLNGKRNFIHGGHGSNYNMLPARDVTSDATAICRYKL